MKPTYWSENLLEMAFESSDDSNTSVIGAPNTFFSYRKWMASLTESPVFSSRTCEKEIQISTRVSNESNRKGTTRNYTQRNRVGTREWILKAGNGADWDVIKKDLEGSARVELVGGFRDEGIFLLSNTTSSTCPKSIFFFSYRVAFPCSYLPFFFIYFPLLSSPCASSFMQQPSVKLLEFCHCPSWYYFPHDPPRAVKTMSSVGTEISILRKYDVLIKLLELRNKKNKTRGKVSWCRSRSQFEPENESATGGVPDIWYSPEISLDS